MTPAEFLSSDLADVAEALRARDEPFAFATIIRTAGATAARPGAKAVIGADGTILHGFLGGGCTRGAVRRATLDAIKTGVPRLVSVAPKDLLAEMGVAPGTGEDGVTYAANGCPSQGTIDIFIEPCLPMPEMIVLGTSPVAEALATLAPQFHWSVQRSADLAQAVRLRSIVVATQGQGDLEALTSALGVEAAYLGFVGSRRKVAALAERLEATGRTREEIGRITAPAGLDIGAVTPEEIALSILGALIAVRRSGASGLENEAKGGT